MKLIQKKRLLYYIKTLGLIFNKESSLINRISHDYIASLERWCKSEGIRGGVARSKAVYTVLVANLLNSEPERSKIWVSSRHGLPLCLRRAGPLIRKDKGPQILLSIVSMHKALILDPEYDISSIEMGYEGKTLDDLYPKIVEGMVTLNLPAFPARVQVEWYLSSKSGPNGQVSWTKWIDDLDAIRDEPHLLDSLVLLLRTYGDSAALRYLRTFSKP